MTQKLASGKFYLKSMTMPKEGEYFTGDKSEYGIYFSPDQTPGLLSDYTGDRESRDPYCEGKRRLLKCCEF